MFTIQQIQQIYNSDDVRSFIDYGLNLKNLRFTSFDYCYGYFQMNQKNLMGKNLEMSCMALWSYLASWGMFRGKSHLCQNCNYKVLQDTIEVIQNYFNNPQAIPDIGSDPKSDYLKKVLDLYNKVGNSFEQNGLSTFNPSETLVTKIILGVFGTFPALDENFCRAFGGGKSVRGFADLIWEFYHTQNYATVINGFNHPIEQFNGTQSSLRYPVAKYIDMFGFFLGGMVEGDKQQIVFHNYYGQPVMVNNHVGNVSNNAITVNKGKYDVEVYFQNQQYIQWTVEVH